MLQNKTLRSSPCLNINAIDFVARVIQKKGSRSNRCGFLSILQVCTDGMFSLRRSVANDEVQCTTVFVDPG